MVKSYPVINGLTSVEEGLAMTFKYPLEDGVAKVQVGSASSTDQFAGVAYYQYRVLPTKLNKVDVLTVPAVSAYIVNLTKLPYAPATELRVVVTSPLGVSTVLIYDASTVDATHYTVSGQVVTVHSSFAGYSLQATYSFTPSATEARNFFGDVRPGLSNTSTLGVINVIQRGVIVTTNFDPAADWAASTPVKIASNGYFAKTSSGMAIPNCIVKEAPSLGKPYLTLELR
jgi:hypothetical protein